MSSTERLIRKGQEAELRERLEASRKRVKRLIGDVQQYVFPRDPLKPTSNQIDLAKQAMDELAAEQAKFEQLEAAIKEFEG